MDIKILTQTTPNPNARKFIVNQPVLNEGKATFSNKQEAGQVTLVRDIFDIAGIGEVHLFDNFITVTKNDENEWLQVEPQIRAIIQTRMPIHDPDMKIDKKTTSRVNRENLSPDLQKIEDILDRTIRPGLQGDGGDLEILGLEGHELQIRYQGACGTCPSAIEGTLLAIESILQNEFNPELKVRAV